MFDLKKEEEEEEKKPYDGGKPLSETKARRVGIDKGFTVDCHGCRSLRALFLEVGAESTDWWRLLHQPEIISDSSLLPPEGESSAEPEMHSVYLIRGPVVGKKTSTARLAVNV